MSQIKRNFFPIFIFFGSILYVSAAMPENGGVNYNGEVNFQVLFNIALSVCSFVGGWILKRVFDTFDKHEALIKEMTKDQAIKNDNSTKEIGEIKVNFASMEAKMDGVEKTVTGFDKKFDDTIHYLREEKNKK